jgi:hypothetical protein
VIYPLSLPDPSRSGLGLLGCRASLQHPFGCSPPTARKPSVKTLTPPGPGVPSPKVERGISDLSALSGGQEGSRDDESISSGAGTDVCVGLHDCHDGAGDSHRNCSPSAWYLGRPG